MITAPMLQVIEQAAEGVMVLADGLTESDYLRSRLTRREVRRLLQLVAGTLAALPDEVQVQMPELDWSGWRHLGRALARDDAAPDDSEWFAVQSLVPALLSWLRVYRRSVPALFDFRAPVGPAAAPP